MKTTTRRVTRKNRTTTRTVAKRAPVGDAVQPRRFTFATIVVYANTMARGATIGLSGDVDLTLERELSGGTTRLSIANRGAITNEDTGSPANLLLHSPDALRALVSALLRLMADPHGAEILRTIDTAADIVLKPDNADPIISVKLIRDTPEQRFLTVDVDGIREESGRPGLVQFVVDSADDLRALGVALFRAADEA
jgi:hypothetical protein